MKYTDYSGNEIFEGVKAITDAMGIRIVQLGSAVVNKTLQVRLVLHKQGGIGIDECGKVSKTVLPKIEMIVDDRDVSMEVSSPGIGRVLKDAYEFSAFGQERVMLLVDGEWVPGTVVSSDEKSVSIEAEGVITAFSYDRIQKAKLD